MEVPMKDDCIHKWVSEQFKFQKHLTLIVFKNRSRKRTSQVVKDLHANARDTRDTGAIPGSGRTPGEGNGNPLQYSWLENSMDRGAWRTIVHGVVKSQTQTWPTMCTHTHTYTHTHKEKEGIQIATVTNSSNPPSLRIPVNLWVWYTYFCQAEVFENKLQGGNYLSQYSYK